MRILHIMQNATIGGVEKLCLDICKRKDDHGFFFIKNDGELFSLFEQNSKRIYVNVTKEKNVKISNIVTQIKSIYFNEGYEAIIFHYSGISNRLVFLKLIKSIKKIYIYAHSNYNDFTFKNNFLKGILNKYLFNKCAQKCAGIFAISNSVKKSILKHIPSISEKIFVNYNGIDLINFSCHNKVFSDDKFKIVYVGRIKEIKGIQDTIIQLGKCNINFSFDIIGDGDYIDELKKIVTKCELDSKIKFLGKKKNIYQLLGNYDYFIHLPKWEEGFGISIIEAMACGLICISNDSGAIPEIITNGVDGFIMSRGNYDLENLFKKILNHNINLNIISSNAICRAKTFDITHVIENIEKIIKNNK